MPPIGFAGTLVHATVTLVAAFFVLFAAERSGRPMRVIGIVLGAWLIVVAIAQVFLGSPLPPSRLPQFAPVTPHAPARAQ